MNKGYQQVNMPAWSTGGRPTMMVLTASGVRKAKALPLIMGDTVEKADIEICKHPSGRGDWLLGTGASGKVCRAVKTYSLDCAISFGSLQAFV